MSNVAELLALARAELAHSETPAGPAEEALTVAARALEELPRRIHELADQVVTLARYARGLEDEIDRYRSAARAPRELGDLTPFEIRVAFPTGAEVWVCVRRTADLIEARSWVAEGHEVAWDTLLRGSLRP